MIHLNEEFKTSFHKTPSLQTIQRLILQSLYPEWYMSTTIDDFVKNVEDIKLTRKILPPGVFYNNKAIITFNNVEYRRTGKNWCEIEDMNDTLKAKILMEDKKIDELRNGSILEQAHIVFAPYEKLDQLWFVNYNMFETQVPERNKYLIPAYAGA